MRSVPVVMSGSFKAAMRLAIDEVADGVAVHDEAKQERGWKIIPVVASYVFTEAVARWTGA